MIHPTAIIHPQARLGQNFLVNQGALAKIAEAVGAGGTAGAVVMAMASHDH